MTPTNPCDKLGYIQPNSMEGIIMRADSTKDNLDQAMRKLIDSARGYLSVHEYEEIITKLGFLSWVMIKSFDLTLSGEPNVFINKVKIGQIIDNVTKIVNKYPNEIIVVHTTNPKNYDLVIDVLDSLNKYKNVEINVFFIEEIYGVSGNIETVRKLLTMGYNENRHGGYTSQYIYDLSSMILNEAEGDRVLDVHSRKGAFVSNFAQKYVNDKVKNKKFHHYTFFEQNYQNSILARIRAAILDIDYDCINEDYLTYNNDANNQPYDKIYCEAPFGVRARWEYFDKYRNILGVESIDNPYLRHSTSLEWFYILKVAKNLSENGKAVAVVPTGVLSKMTDSVAREYLVNQGLLESIIDLPAGSYPNTIINVSLLVISNNNSKIKMIDATTLVKKSKFNTNQKPDDIFKIYKSITDSGIVRWVSAEDINENYTNLNPKLYTEKASKPYINPTPLENVVKEIYRGYQITSKEREEFATDSKQKSIKVLTLSDVEDNSISNSLSRIKDDDYRFHRYYLHNGDIVISAKGEKVKLAVAKLKNKTTVGNHYSEPDIILPTGNIMVIRPNEDLIDSYYLCAFLQSDAGKRLLSSIQTGTVLKSINASLLSKIKIPLIPREQQKRIGERYSDKIALQKSLKKQILEIQHEFQTIADNVIYED